MGVRDLVSAFNSVGAAAGLTCVRATLRYEWAHDAESQILTFYGRRADGSAFEAEEKLRAGADVMAGARAAAQKMIDQPAETPQ